MSRLELSTKELFLRLGATPATRSARADQLFRRLRSDDEEALTKSLLSAPGRLNLGPSADRAKDKSGD